MNIYDLNLYIVDDDQGLLDSLVLLFTARQFRVQTFKSGEDFLSRADIQSCGCVILDVDMKPRMSGLQVFDELRRLHSPLVVILYSAVLDVPIATGYTRKGAFDVLEKGPEAESLLTESVQRAMQRAVDVSSKMQSTKEKLVRWNELTPREKEVAKLVRKGWRSKLVGDELGINERTSDGYRAKVYDKLWVNNPVELDQFLRDIDIN